MKFLLITVLTVVVAVGCASFSRNGHRDARLFGEWTGVSAIIDGKSLSDETVKALRLTITETRYITEKGAETLFDSAYRVDLTKRPSQIFMVGNEGALVGKEAQGIYEVSDNLLRICYAMPGDPVPTRFESAAGSKAHFVVWRRSSEK
ncbi:MAG TPA: TIGR03067 domain-containing protein [Verrucomicrobiae bacterium]|nr:TIGR03067 domain-containing protein [Verrucomicrobiae bacterium]